MKECIVIACFTAILYLLYRFLYACLANFAKKELRRSGISWQTADTIHMEAMTQNLEYYARMALLASDGGRLAIVVHIRKNDKDRAALLWMAEKFSARHQNLKVNLF